MVDAVQQRVSSSVASGGGIERAKARARVGPRDFEVLRLIGEGGYGKVSVRPPVADAGPPAA